MSQRMLILDNARPACPAPGLQPLGGQEIKLCPLAAGRGAESPGVALISVSSLLVSQANRLVESSLLGLIFWLILC